MTAVATISNRNFGLFPYLHEDLKLSVLSFLADAPFEAMPDNYPKSSLTHKLPHVSKKFKSLCDMDCYWKVAIERQVKREPFLWKRALQNMCACASTDDSNKTSSCSSSSSIEELINSAHRAVGKPSFKSMYQQIVTKYLRFKGPVFFMPGQVQLGQPYGLHLFEPRYRLLIAEVMKDQSDDAKHGGRIHGDALFLHANRAPLAPTTPATLVHVMRCELHEDGRADVLLLPVAFVWLERIWVRPNSGHLFYAQSLRMGERVTQDMNRLARQEALASVMDRLAGDLMMSTDDSDDDLNPFTAEEEEHF